MVRASFVTLSNLRYLNITLGFLFLKKYKFRERVDFLGTPLGILFRTYATIEHISGMKTSPNLLKSEMKLQPNEVSVPKTCWRKIRVKVLSCTFKASVSKTSSNESR